MGNNADSQALALVITPKITSFISFPCSMYIIYQSVVDHRKGKGTVIQRALVGMSIIDLFASSGWFLSTWAVRPSSGVEEEDLLPLMSGNRITCNYQGFLLQLAIGAPLYNGTIALYSLLMVRYKWKDHHLRKIEPYVHVSILGFAVGTSIAGLLMGMYNPVGNVCWVIGEPADCGNSNYMPNEDVPCERGDWAWLFGVVLFYAPLWCVIILVVIAMMLIMEYAKRTFRRVSKYAGSKSRAMNSQGQKGSREKKTMKLIARQSIMYSSSFIVTWMPSTIWSIAHWFGFTSFWIDFAACFCEPLQGFWNCAIFLYKLDSRNGTSTTGRRSSVQTRRLSVVNNEQMKVLSPQDETLHKQQKQVSEKPTMNQKNDMPSEKFEDEQESDNFFSCTSAIQSERETIYVE